MEYKDAKEIIRQLKNMRDSDQAGCLFKSAMNTAIDVVLEYYDKKDSYIYVDQNEEPAVVLPIEDDGRLYESGDFIHIEGNHIADYDLVEQSPESRAAYVDYKIELIEGHIQELHSILGGHAELFSGMIESVERQDQHLTDLENYVSSMDKSHREWIEFLKEQLNDHAHEDDKVFDHLDEKIDSVDRRINSLRDWFCKCMDDNDHELKQISNRVASLEWDKYNHNRINNKSFESLNDRLEALEWEIVVHGTDEVEKPWVTE